MNGWMVTEIIFVITFVGFIIVIYIFISIFVMTILQYLHNIYHNFQVCKSKKNNFFPPQHLTQSLANLQ